MNGAKRNLIRIFSFLLCLFVICSGINMQVDADSSSAIRVGWYEDSYNITGKNNEKSGYGYEYQQTIAGYTGWKYHYVKNGWSNLLADIQEGKIDLLSGVSYTDERAKTMLFSQLPMGYEKYYLYADFKNTDISTSKLSTLNEKRVGLLKDSVQATQFIDWEKENNIQMQYVYVSSFEEAKQKVKNHEIDCVVSTETPAWIDLGMSSITVIGGSDIYFVVNKNRPDIKEELDTAMRKLENDKPFYADELYQRYLSAASSSALTSVEKDWLDQNKSIKMGYLKNDSGISVYNESTQQFSGVITDYISQIHENMSKKIQFSLYEYDSQDELIQALKTHQIDMIFHFNKNPYVAEKNGFILSDTVLSKSLSAVTSKSFFNEDNKNTVAVLKGDLFKNWYISYNYPNWKIKEMSSLKEIIRAVKDEKVDCFIVENGQASQYEKDRDFYCVNLKNHGDICFAVNRKDAVLLSILNKTLTVASPNMLTASLAMYENEEKKVGIFEFVQDHYVVFTLCVLGILISILILLHKSKLNEEKAKKSEEKTQELNVRLRENQAQLQVALIEAKSANQAKTSFLNNMSHDIRTPMNAIMGFTDIALKKEPSSEIKNCLMKINESSQVLLTLINDVLDISRIESGNSELNLKITYLPDVVDSALTVMTGLLSNRNLQFMVHKGTLKNPYVMVDALKLRDILVNILSNAVKYTDDNGSVEFIEKYKEIDKNHMLVHYEIVDTGIGMSKEFQKHIFDEFSQEQKGARTQYKGTGLGMSITKKYVDMMQGTISIQSEKGKGSTFIVEIPLEIANEKKANIQNKKLNVESLKHSYVLLAEDNDLNAEIAMVQLEEVGMHIDRVKNGKEVVDVFMAHPEKYDVILMDIMMPEMDGYEATLAIRHLPYGKKIPIIALTANAFSEDEQKSMDSGMNGHVSKPIVMENLLQVMVQCMTK